MYNVIIFILNIIICFVIEFIICISLIFIYNFLKLGIFSNLSISNVSFTSSMPCVKTILNRNGDKPINYINPYN